VDSFRAPALASAQTPSDTVPPGKAPAHSRLGSRLKRRAAGVPSKKFEEMHPLATANQSARFATLLLLIVGAFTVRTATGQPVPAPAAGSPPPSAAFACPISVMDIVPLGVLHTDGVLTYAVGIQAFVMDAARVSGTLTLLAGRQRYDVPFVNAVAAGATSGSLAQIVPIVVRFEKPTLIDAAYVSSLAGPNAGPCEVAGAAVRSGPLHRTLDWGPLDVAARIEERAASVASIPAPAPVQAEDGSCDQPFAPAQTTDTVSPDTPKLAKDQRHAGAVYIDVAIGRDGKVVTAWIWQSPGFAELERAALAAAKASKYKAARVACRPVEGLYVFVVEFAAAS
jgi:TonB family protein